MHNSSGGGKEEKKNKRVLPRSLARACPSVAPTFLFPFFLFLKTNSLLLCLTVVLSISFFTFQLFLGLRCSPGM